MRYDPKLFIFFSFVIGDYGLGLAREQVIDACLVKLFLLHIAGESRP